MKHVMFSVYDLKGRLFGMPFYAPNVEIGTRYVAAAVNGGSADSMLSKFPSDFRLYKLGEFSDDDGAIEALAVPEMIVECSALVKE